MNNGLNFSSTYSMGLVSFLYLQNTKHIIRQTVI